MSKIGSAMCFLAAVLLGLLSCLSCVCWQGNRILTDRELHERSALTDEALSLQETMVRAALPEALADSPVDPTHIAELVTRDSLIQLNRDMIAWWMDIPAGGSEKTPVWYTEGLREAVLSDETFQSSVHRNRQARMADTVTDQITEAVTEAAAPVRRKVLSLGAGIGQGKADLPRWAAVLRYMPLLLVLICLALCSLILLLKARDMARAAGFIGSGLLSGGLLTAAVPILAKSLGAMQMLQSLSPLMASQVKATADAVWGSLGLAAGILAAAGLILLTFGGTRREKKA